MLITIKRTYYRAAFTLGALQIQTDSNPEYLQPKYFCDTLEPHAIDWSRELKVPGRTAIPTGCYKVTLRYSSTFKRMMPFLEGVPHFVGIMIHTGNSPDDTRGCILVGRAARPVNNENDNENPDENENPNENRPATVIGWVSDSRATFRKLFKLIEQAVKHGEEVWVKVKGLSPRPLP